MDNSEQVKILVEEFVNKGYGGAMTHYEISRLVGVKEGTRRYQSIIDSAKKKLLEHGKMIDNVRGVGYRVIDPDEYTGQSARCVISGARRIDKGTKILQNAPVKDMSQEGVQTYNRVVDRMKILQAAICGAKVEINMLSSKREHPLLYARDRAETVR